MSCGCSSGVSIPKGLQKFHVFDPRQGEFFDKFGSQLVAALGGVETLVRFRIGVDEMFRVSAIGMEPDSNSLVGIGDLLFTLLINKIPHRFYSNMADQIGTGQRPTDTFALLDFPGGLVEFQVTNNNATNAALAFGRIQGWTMPLDDGRS